MYTELKFWFQHFPLNNQSIVIFVKPPVATKNVYQDITFVMVNLIVLMDLMKCDAVSILHLYLMYRINDIILYCTNQVRFPLRYKTFMEFLFIV